MSNPSSKSKRLPYTCTVCGLQKSPAAFPALKATVCSACVQAELEVPAPKVRKTPSLRIKSLPPEPEQATTPSEPRSDLPEAPPDGSAGEIFVPSSPERNPADPTMQEMAARKKRRKGDIQNAENGAD